MPVQIIDVDAMTALIETIVDSYEILEVVVHLHRIQPQAESARSIARILQLDPESVATALAKLERAGILRSNAQADDAGWRFDPGATWASSIDVLVRLYDLDRTELLAVIKHVGVQYIKTGDSTRAWFMSRRKTRRGPERPN